MVTFVTGFVRFLVTSTSRPKLIQIQLEMTMDTLVCYALSSYAV